MREPHGVQRVGLGSCGSVPRDSALVHPASLELSAYARVSGRGAVHLLIISEPLDAVVVVTDHRYVVNYLHRPRPGRLVPQESRPGFG